MTDASPDASVAATGEDSSKSPSVFLVSYPKIVFLYPTVFVALFGAIYMMANGNDPSADYAAMPAKLFLISLALNLVVIAFDFPRTTSLTMFFAIAFGVILLVLLFSSSPGLLPWFEMQLNSIRPKADATFYILYILMMCFLFVCVVISRRFDYWEVRGNELLHHHGMLSDLKRYSAPNLRIDKEINDILEYLLLRSGRLILHPSQERRAIVLENVFFINKKEDTITQMLGALQVRVRTDSD